MQPLRARRDRAAKAQQRVVERETQSSVSQTSDILLSAQPAQRQHVTASTARWTALSPSAYGRRTERQAKAARGQFPCRLERQP